MPFIRVDWFPGRTLEQKPELAEVATREFSRIADCRPETINFIVTEVGRETWGTQRDVALRRVRVRATRALGADPGRAPRTGGGPTLQHSTSGPANAAGGT
ncbi:tautomerase family protein [Pseudonocardia sp. N23]|uniref:tautomerase family protein n=1 Tax=Pseudonocardia sp. N23 TaxID=1987376 RepID=UPI000BFD6D57|nr:tautomerase family protein [Pseudonocardia sp. N23]